MQAHSISEDKAEKLLFKRIYDAAKIQDEKTITAMLSESCIDVQHAGEGTPVSRLAAEGEIEAVNFLKTKFKASLLWMASGYARGGHVDEAKKVLAQASNPAERLAVIKKIVPALKSKGIFLNNESALFALALFNPDSQNEIAKELKDSKTEMKTDVMTLIPKATLLHPLITTPSIFIRPINYRYRLGFNWPTIQDWLLMTGVFLVKKGKLNNHTLLTITTFLVPLSHAESLNLSNRMFTAYRPDLFYSNLSTHNRLLTTDTNIPEKNKDKQVSVKR